MAKKDDIFSVGTEEKEMEVETALAGAKIEKQAEAELQDLGEEVRSLGRSPTKEERQDALAKVEWIINRTAKEMRASEAATEWARFSAKQSLIISFSLDDSIRSSSRRAMESRIAAVAERSAADSPRDHRVNVNFSEEAWGTLDRLAQRSGKSKSDVLREAIALKAWFEQTRDEGGHVLVERPDGRVREVISV
jgi:hypothetical protein